MDKAVPRGENHIRTTNRAQQGNGNPDATDLTETDVKLDRRWASSGTTANRTVPASASGGGEARSGSWSWRLTPWSGRGKIRELELAPDTMVRQRQENQALSGRRIVNLPIQLVKVLLFYAAMTANCFNLIINKICLTCHGVISSILGD